MRAALRGREVHNLQVSVDAWANRVAEEFGEDSRPALLAGVASATLQSARLSVHQTLEQMQPVEEEE